MQNISNTSRDEGCGRNLEDSELSIGHARLIWQNKGNTSHPPCIRICSVSQKLFAPDLSTHQWHQDTPRSRLASLQGSLRPPASGRNLATLHTRLASRVVVVVANITTHRPLAVSHEKAGKKLEAPIHSSTTTVCMYVLRTFSCRKMAGASAEISRHADPSKSLLPPHSCRIGPRRRARRPPTFPIPRGLGWGARGRRHGEVGTGFRRDGAQPSPGIMHVL
jgi:hypothetical protein